MFTCIPYPDVKSSEGREINLSLTSRIMYLYRGRALSRCRYTGQQTMSVGVQQLNKGTPACSVNIDQNGYRIPHFIWSA